MVSNLVSGGTHCPVSEQGRSSKKKPLCCSLCFIFLIASFSNSVPVSFEELVAAVGLVGERKNALEHGRTALELQPVTKHYYRKYPWNRRTIFPSHNLGGAERMSFHAQSVRKSVVEPPDEH